MSLIKPQDQLIMSMFVRQTSIEVQSFGNAVGLK